MLPRKLFTCNILVTLYIGAHIINICIISLLTLDNWEKKNNYNFLKKLLIFNHIDGFQCIFNVIFSSKNVLFIDSLKCDVLIYRSVDLTMKKISWNLMIKEMRVI